jgi:hypothetical protein
MRFPIQLIIAATASSSIGVASAGATWCSPRETVVFSCSVGHKVASLCASTSEQGQVSALRYQYGVLTRKSELAFPNRGQNWLDVFTAHFESWAKGSYSVVYFARGEFTYAIYSRHAAFEIDERSNGSGIRVKKAGVEIADLWCDARGAEDAMATHLLKAGLKEAPRDAL